MKYIRLKFGKMQIARNTYIGRNGHKIVLQGASHLASGSFYEQVLNDIRDFDGVAHIEKVRKAGAKNEELLRKSVEGKLEREAMAHFSGLKSQTDYFNEELFESDEKFHNVDVTMMSMKDTILMLPALFVFGEGNKKKVYDRFQDLPFILKKIVSSPRLFAFALAMKRKFKGDKEMERIVITVRNEYAISSAIRLDTPVFMFWGAAHMYGMDDLLTRYDYKLERQEWLDAIVFNNVNEPDFVAGDAVLAQIAELNPDAARSSAE